MKSFLIQLNLAISILAILAINPDRSSLMAVVLVFFYFLTSSGFFLYARRKGWLNNLAKY